MSRFQRLFLTGASSGIGAALAREFARDGVEVVLTARRLDRLESLAAELRGAGARVHVAELDVLDTAAVNRTVHEFDRRLGGIDLFVANAGVGNAAHASVLRPQDVELTLRVNLLGAAATILAGLECLRPHGRGTLCAVSSLAALGGMPAGGAYSASKAGLSTLLETLAIDLYHTDIEVIDVQPGYVVSEMTAGRRGPMPLLWSTERAARRIVRDLERGRSISTFPWALSTAMRLATRLPRPLWRRALAALRVDRSRRSTPG
jgi:NAD(P)-dependent dehydrogenase (short-subunit alcohol dehydrogenase family)